MEGFGRKCLYDGKRSYTIIYTFFIDFANKYDTVNIVELRRKVRLLAVSAMGRFRERMTRFMYGRYGMDQLSRMINYVSFALLIITLFTNSSLIYMLALAGIIYSYYRAFSRNISRRYSENQAYLKVKYDILRKFNNYKLRLKDQKTHRIFKCPSCAQKIRVPRGKGRISIKCPKCRIEFTRKS